MAARRRPSSLERDAAALYDAAGEFIRFYQFRDRNAMLKSGLTVAQAYALEILLDLDGARLTTLAQRLRLDKSTTSRIVAGMIRRGLAGWSRDEHDRRAKHIVASPEGKRRYAQHRRTVERENARLLGSYTAAGRRTVIAGLRELTRGAVARMGPSSS